MSWFDAHVAEGWEMQDAGGLLETLNASEDWSSCFVWAADLGLFLSAVQSIKYMAVPLTCTAAENAEGNPPRSVRRRLRFKQQRPPAFVLHPAEPPPVPAIPEMCVRAPKSRQTPSYRIHAEGAFVCEVCQRRFPTKGGMLSHVRAVHTEGAFREAGFQCSCCPRLFAGLAKRTQHYTRDHCRNSTALTCPHCSFVFPGEPMLRLHMADAHEVSSSWFPNPCPLCVAGGDADPVFITTVLTFK